ncbi:hypothetical protein [Staphylococcus aureus]|uniref:hypothetical protein n=1 Tax=Staphylococcus aureus TaxID=1280 RepID=UPI001F1E5E57|nr:hypothetical protein [Staphylococcus aureus]
MTGPTGHTGVTGPTGATGPTGITSNVFGTFGSFYTGTILPGQILPLTVASSNNTTGAFTINADGSLTIIQSGNYIADGRIQLAPGSSGVYGIQVNGNGINVSYYNAGSAETIIGNSGVITISTVLTLNAGDKVSLVRAGTSTIANTFLGAIDAVTTPTGALKLIRIGP